ncbi:MAG: hypothetical protein A3K19_12555 [Lentisphaerae bacterium RIFOXYB12_FULL_65_16]|nr:MAG: hypothetical protein A3K18_12120 [Lentisphaerae bacterium RIFOXYA12_64_32]OGV88114.1 MAG: hypothetical protein A3K19_12555 [Lentisphaerae bacterium RIFOXYB12_FULL_65_16]
MTETPASYGDAGLDSRILTLRGQKVILDTDLAQLYGVPTKALNQAVRRNREKFPTDFMFQLAAQEVADLISQTVTACRPDMRSQIVTASTKRNVRFPPYAFTEHGAIMAATVLNSPRAVQMSIFVVRAFVRMRQAFAGSQVLEKRLADIEKNLVLHDTALRDLYAKIRPLLLPPSVPSKTRIGFGIREKHAAYRVRLTRRRRTAG